MRKTWLISIRSKILFVLSAVLVAAVGLYLYLASQLFFEDKKLLVYELNQTSVRSLGQEIETYFKLIMDKLEILSSMQNNNSKTMKELLPELVSEEEGFLRIAILDSNSKTRMIANWPKLLELNGKDESYLDRIRNELPIPFSRVIEKGVWIRNATLPNAANEENPAILTIAVKANPQEVIYADLKLDQVLKSFSGNKLAHTYLMDSDGFSLADSDHEKISTTSNLKDDPMMMSALSSKLRSELKSYTVNNVSYLGSFFRLGLADLVVGSRTQTGQAYEAAQVLIRKSLLYALIVVTAAFLIALFLSHSITVPIRKMLDATHQIAQGDFEVSIPISTHDELAILSDSFNSMTVDLKTSREQIQEYSRDLEKKVADRTAQLEKQNIAIKEAQEALVRTTRLASVGEIAGRAAHEVLNPLTNISTRIEKVQQQLKKDEAQDLSLFNEIVTAWKTEGVEKAASTPSTAMAGKTLLEEDLENLSSISSDFSKRQNKLQDDLDFLMKESMRINKIVNGMRQLTRVTGAKKTLSVHQVIQESTSTMLDILSKNKIKVETQFCNADPKIKGDADELLQVFSNLIRNSMQAFKEHPDTTKQNMISFSTAMIQKEKGTMVQIRVSDNGPGIPAEHQPRIFESNFTTKGIEDGTGLGLAICRRFIRAYDGEISLEPTESGTTFLIELPEASLVEGGTA